MNTFYLSSKILNYNLRKFTLSRSITPFHGIFSYFSYKTKYNDIQSFYLLATLEMEYNYVGTEIYFAFSVIVSSKSINLI